MDKPIQGVAKVKVLYRRYLTLFATIFFLGGVSDHSLSHAQSNNSQANINDLSIDFTLKPCQIKSGPKSIDAQCATLRRPENPDNPDGKQLDLFIAKFAARSTDPEADAFTIIQGGPGGSSIDLYMGLQSIFHEIRAHRDIIVIDQRGTGRSNLLGCPEIAENQVVNPDEIRRLAIQCRQDLEARTNSDLSFYTTSLAVQDLEALRIAAGYTQLTIYGVSYGTRVAQHYLRRFTESTRAVILDGVVPVGLNLAGGEIARRSQAAFDNMVQRCNDSEDCVAQFGDLERKFKELRQRLKDQPMTVSLPDPYTGKPTSQLVNDQNLLAAIRLMPYSTEQLSLLPNLIATAHAGDYLGLAAFSKIITERFKEAYAIGMNNSVMCAEDAPFVKQSDLLGIDDTYFDTLMVDAVSATCQEWPRGPMDDDFRDAFDSKQPVLILSGETDPITPPDNGEIANQMLSNSLHLVVPAHGHGVISKGCIPQLASDFVEHVDLSLLNPNCIKRERASPFFFGTTGPQP
ncbi:MAG: pimeloyl-ACP methyl ester carboxylesterase [Arenicella sp.]|jgi:pimeloyl-ACP methyl ester carboxylesterase